MKFVNVKQAKGISVGDQVYTLNDDGKYGIGRLQSRSEDAKGLHLKFEIPQYSDNPLPVKPLVVDNITHVCVIKDRTLKTATDVSDE